MTISRKEKEVPRDLPPARLYLDDLEMVMQIFKDAQSQGGVPPETKFEIDDQVCTEMTELPKIADTTKNLSMDVMMPQSRAALIISPTFTTWYSFGLDRKEEWSLHSRLEPIFRARERTLVALAHKIPPAIFSAGMGILGTLILFPWLVRYSMPFTIFPTPSNRLPLSFAMALLLLWLIQDNLRSSHTIVVLSRYSESSAKRRESSKSKAWDIAKIVLGPIIGALMLWLAQHLVHEFWH